MKKYDLEERTTIFGCQVVKLCQTISVNHINRSIINQLIRSGTSIGANYREANGATSKKDFRCKIHLCKKETNETKHWLEILLSCTSSYADKIKYLYEECHELILIFQTIINSLKK